MVQGYKGHFVFSREVIQTWNNDQGGVYYCGILNSTGQLIPHYVGKAFGEGGIRGRLLQHLNENKWRDITHFGYCVCSSENETFDFETQEIRKHNPKYNTQGRL
jgi:excinuclease UvrABC nuclease subunit